MKEPRRKVAFDLTIVFLLVILFVSIYTVILQRNYNASTLENAVQWDTHCSDAIHRLVSNKFTREDFQDIVTAADMDSPRFLELQRQLNELRSLNSTRYLYTAKRGDDGRLIYLIDGLELGAQDFAYPGTYIEEEMIPYIDQALQGNIIYSQEIIDTTWGHIFTACYPVQASDGTDDIIGALCIEIDMEETYRTIAQNNRTTLYIAAVVAIVLIGLGVALYLYFHRRKEADAIQKEALREAVTAADAANLAKSTFLFNMSHDIRTPMNAILGFAELAEENLSAPEKIKSYLEKISICGKKMLAILDNVLELSRIEAGKVVLEEVAVECAGMIDNCLVMVQPEIDKKHQQLSVKKDIIAPYAYMDTTRITEIILNLISNSIKYTGEFGHIQCVLSQKPDQREGWMIQEFTVSDDGIGMSEEFQSHIYESFSRERSSTLSGVEGTGLGMGIVKKLVDMMGGTIELHSKVGSGSTFVVSIPCRIASLEDTQPKRAETMADPSLLKGRHILLAEDNDLNAEIAIELLSEVGLVVERAENGVRCVEMLEKADEDYYSMILMDVQMPVLNGYDATRKIRNSQNKTKSEIPIIAMTANAFAEDRQKALSVGMNDHVAKPIDMSKLIPTILKYLK